MRKLRPLDTINLFKDIHYVPLKNVCDSVFKQLHQKGVGTETKETPVLSIDDKMSYGKKFWTWIALKVYCELYFFVMATTFACMVAKSREI